MGNAVAEYDPAIGGPSLPFPRVGDVNRFEGGEPDGIACRKRPDGDRTRVIAQNSPAAPRTVLGIMQSNEGHGTENDPRDVEHCVAAIRRWHAAIITSPMTRAELAEELLTIVRDEKTLAMADPAPETLLSDAGIDSLDALTILFAIEERFRISIPDEQARAMRTFGDLTGIVEALLPR